MRQFAEREDRRLNPDRASVGRALVLAVGKVPALPELPGVFDEADHVGAAARRARSAPTVWTRSMTGTPSSTS